MSRLLAAVLFLALPACNGVLSRPDDVSVAAHEILTQPDRLELLAIDPRPLSMHDPKPTGPAFHDHPILGRAVVTDADQQQSALRLIYGGIHASDGTVAACFNPRHGIRAERGGRTVDLVICYECLSMKVIGPAETASVTTTSTPGEALTGIFAAHGVTVAQ